MQATLDVAIADDVGGIDADELLDAVANPRRRRTLGALCELDGGVEVSDLAAEVCRRASDDGDADVDDADRRLVAASLHHHHLPYLDDLGLVSYDVEERSVTLEVDPDDVELRADLDA